MGSLRRAAVIANLLVWAVFWTWFAAALTPIATYRDYDHAYHGPVDFVVTQTLYLRPGSGPSSALMVPNLPSFGLAVLVMPEPSNRVVLGLSMMTWRIVLAMAISFLQWFAIASGIGWLRTAGKWDRPGSNR